VAYRHHRGAGSYKRSGQQKGDEHVTGDFLHLGSLFLSTFCGAFVLGRYLSVPAEMLLCFQARYLGALSLEPTMTSVTLCACPKSVQYALAPESGELYEAAALPSEFSRIPQESIVLLPFWEMATVLSD
jgi:hypothetical protein